MSDRRSPPAGEAAVGKLYYKIGEACKLLDIQPYVLRYWETEFPVLQPNKSRSGQRVYTERELDVIRRIKELLYDEGYTIAGAKKKLEGELLAGGPLRPSEPVPVREPSRVGGGDGDDNLALPLDTPPVAGIESRRSGIEEALRQSREILELLARPLSRL